MNIWMLNHYAVSPDMPGGTRHFDFGKELAKRGYYVTIFASSFHYAKLKEMKLEKKDRFKIEEYDGIKFVWIRVFPYSKNNWRRVVNMLSYSWRVYSLAKTLNLERPHMIIGSSVHLFAVFTAYLLARHFKSCFIMEVRDLWPQTLTDMGVSRWHPFVVILGLLERFLYKTSEKILTPLPKAYEYIESLGIPKEKIVWMPNGVNLNRFDLGRDTLKSKDDFVVMYAGALGAANKLEVIIRCADLVFKSFPQIKFVLIGDGPEKPKLVKMAEKMRLSNIEFKGLVSKREILKCLKGSNVLFFNLEDSPVFRFGISSNKLFDYLASARPVIFSCNAVNNPVAEAGAGITIPPNDPKALADAVIGLRKMSEEERETMGKRGREYVEKYYNISVLASRLDRVLKEVWKGT